MKKLLLFLSLSVLALPAFALDPIVNSFTLPRQQVFITNNTTVLYGATNIQFVNPIGNIQWSLSTNTVIPVYVGGQTVNGINIGGTAYYTNTVTTNAIVAGLPWNDINLWPNKNADSNQTPMALFVNMLLDNGAGPGSTNLVTLTFYKEFGTNVDNSAADALTWVIPITGNTNLVASTNITAAFQEGATGLRLQKVLTANSTTNLFLQILNMGVSGFGP